MQQRNNGTDTRRGTSQNTEADGTNLEGSRKTDTATGAGGDRREYEQNIQETLENERLSADSLESHIQAKPVNQILEDIIQNKETFNNQNGVEGLIQQALPEIPVSGRTFEALKKDGKELSNTLEQMVNDGETALIKAFYSDNQKLLIYLMSL